MCTATKSHLCIHFLGIARPQSQFPHSFFCDRFIQSQDRSTFLAAAKQADRKSLMCWIWETEHYNSVLEIRRLHSFISWEYINGNQSRHLYWILTGSSFAVCKLKLGAESFYLPVEQGRMRWAGQPHLHESDSHMRPETHSLLYQLTVSAILVLLESLQVLAAPRSTH